MAAAGTAGATIFCERQLARLRYGVALGLPLAAGGSKGAPAFIRNSWLATRPRRRHAHACPLKERCCTLYRAQIPPASILADDLMIRRAHIRCSTPPTEVACHYAARKAEIVPRAQRRVEGWRPATTKGIHISRFPGCPPRHTRRHRRVRSVRQASWSPARPADSATAGPQPKFHYSSRPFCRHRRRRARPAPEKHNIDERAEAGDRRPRRSTYDAGPLP